MSQLQTPYSHINNTPQSNRLSLHDQARMAHEDDLPSQKIFVPVAPSLKIMTQPGNFKSLQKSKPISPLPVAGAESPNCSILECLSPTQYLSEEQQNQIVSVGEQGELGERRASGRERQTDSIS